MRANAPVRDGKADWPEPGDEQRTVRALAITQIFVDLVGLEQDRAGDLHLEAFRTSPTSHWPDRHGHTLEPDAFIRVARGDTTGFWWLEVDQELESTALMLAKVRAYLDFLRHNKPSPDEVVPRIMIGVLTEARTEALRFMLGGLPEPTRQMFVVTVLSDAAKVIQQDLKAR